MARGRSTDRYIVSLGGEDWPHVFFDQSPAQAFFQKNKDNVIEFIHETLVSEFDVYLVWRQNVLYPGAAR